MSNSSIFAFKSFNYEEYINNINKRVNLSLSTKFKPLVINALRYLTILERSCDFNNFLNFLKSIIHTNIYKRFPFSEKFAVYIYHVRGKRFSNVKDKFTYRCACNRMRLQISNKNWFINRNARFLPWLEIKPDSFNDNIAVYLFSNNACCPECRIMSYIMNQDREGVLNQRKMNQDRSAYLLAYYSDMCRLSFQLCMKMYDGYELWDDNTPLVGDKFNTYIDMMWKTYAFTIILAYKLSSDNQDDTYGVDMTLGGIGFDWFNFKPDYTKVSHMESEILKYMEIMHRSYTLFLRQHKRSKVTVDTVTKLKHIEYDYTFHDSFIEFLDSIPTYESRVLSLGIRKVDFSPFKEFEKYLQFKQSEKLPKDFVKNRFYKQFVDIWRDIKMEEPEVIKKGYESIDKAWEDIKTRL